MIDGAGGGGGMLKLDGSKLGETGGGGGTIPYLLGFDFDDDDDGTGGMYSAVEPCDAS